MRPVRAKALIIRLLPLQGVRLVWRIFTQGVALGYVLLPLRGVLLTSFDTPSPEISSICVDLCNLWEALPSRRFCEFCVFRGRSFVLRVSSRRFHRIQRGVSTLLGWCTSCSVGALETSAPPAVCSICEFCVFCGRTSPAEGSVNSAYSVGGHPQQKVL